jgi:hypothetical protein
LLAFAALKSMALVQRKLPIPNCSFLEAQFQSFTDPSALIHNGQHRSQPGQSPITSEAPKAAIREFNFRVFGAACVDCTLSGFDWRSSLKTAAAFQVVSIDFILML